MDAVQSRFTAERQPELNQELVAIQKKYEAENAAYEKMGPGERLDDAKRRYNAVHHGNKPIFEIYGSDGHEWKIYANGRVEGFPSDCTIVNSTWLLEATAKTLTNLGTLVGKK
jgi:hypothetical protein